VKAWHGGALISKKYLDRTYHFKNVQRMSDCPKHPTSGMTDSVEGTGD